MIDVRYRVWLLRELALNLSPAIGVVFLGLRYLDRYSSTGVPWLGNGTKTLVYLLSVPAAAFVRRTISRLWYAYRSWKLGVPQAPVLRGKRIGNLDLLQRFAKGMRQGYPGYILDELLDEAGVDTARMSLLWTPDKIITRDHDVVKFVLSTGFTDFGKGPGIRLRASILFGNGIFTSDGSWWKFHRSLARPHFSRERIMDYEIFVKYTEKLIHCMKQLVQQGEVVDVQELFARFTLDTAGEFLFGAGDLNTLDLPLPKAGHAVLGQKGAAMGGTYGEFVTAFEEAQIRIITRSAAPTQVWTAREFFHDTLSGTKKVIDDFLAPLVLRALENKKSGQLDEEGSFLDHLASSMDDPKVIKEQLLNMLLAARDTTASLLSFVCYMLARHPHVMEKLQEEVLSLVGTSHHPSYDELKQLRYLRAVLNETLRLFPPVPVNSRVSLSETVIPTRQGPIYVPVTETQVIYSIISIQKRKDLWGEDADEFDPERWLDHRAKEAAADPFKFTPFSAGPRICIGQQFAYNEASYVMVRLIQTFKDFAVAQEAAAPPGCLPPENWKSSKGRKATEDVVVQSALTLYAKGGMWLRMDLV
ncbi:hypothetical protein FRB99_005757 [Tulasnella sp. 403]|nr:hypothetical protein FRB99_005757 [Tulasnella sp. 403]